MKLWIDDVRPAPEGYVWMKTTNDVLRCIRNRGHKIELIDLDHDAGTYISHGGDYIEILKEMERLRYIFDYDFSHIKFRLHSANPVGVENMRAIIEKNHWKEVR